MQISCQPASTSAWQFAHRRTHFAASAFVVANARVRGWNMTPSHYIGQDLVEVWLER